MKRQYIHALLIGVLTVATVGTLTSCKEYDGDISDLREQVERAALKTDLETLQATVKNVQTADSITAANAKKAIEALDAHDLAQMENSIKDNAQKVADAIESTNTDIQNLKAENQKAVDEAAAKISADMKEQLEKWGGSLDGYYTAKEINEKLDSLKEAVNKVTDDQLADLKKTVESYKTNINALYSAVTGVSLYLNSSTTDWQLQFVSGTVAQDYDFGKKETAANDTVFTATPIVSYKKGAAINLPTELKIRVSPVNATLTPNMIKLVDSEGNNLDDILQVKSVEKVVGLHTKATQGTGLWSVYLQVKDGVDAEKTTRMSGDKYIAYAVAVNNTATAVDTAAISSADASSRYVVSAYDLILKGTTAYNTNITTLDNIKVAAESEADDESSWMALSKWSTKTEGENPVLGVQNGENIRLDLSALRNQADRFYVAVDYSDTDQKSDMTEYNAWKSYQYNNLNKVYEVSTENPTVSVTINGQADDEVQFRLFAVNYDGTLVEQNGKAFRVKVGAETTVSTATSDITASKKDEFQTGWVALDKALAKGGNLAETYNNKYVMLKQGNTNMLVAKVEFADKDEKSTTTDENVKYIRFTITNEMGYELNSDGLTYQENSSSSTIKNALANWEEGTTVRADLKDTQTPTVNRLSAVLTKVLPSETLAKEIAKVSFKGGQLEDDGSYIACMTPLRETMTESWDWAASYGYIDMSGCINGLVAGAPLMIKIANAALDSDDKFTKDLIVGADFKNWKMYLSPKTDADGNQLIDTKTPHKASILYDFGKINSEDKDNDYCVAVDTRNYIFGCYLDSTIQKYEWKKYTKNNSDGSTEEVPINELTYGNSIDEKQNLFQYILGTNKKSADFSKTIFELIAPKVTRYYNNSQVDKNWEVKLYTKSTTNEDYYQATLKHNKSTMVDDYYYPLYIELTPKSSVTPSYDIPSTLHIGLMCAFLHKHVYELPFTIKAPK